jgi:tRNA (guanine-N7-)-methyltransferase
MEKDIYDVYVICKEISSEKELSMDFNFNIVKYKKGIEACLPQKAIVASDYFVHIERLYRIGGTQLLVKCSFGSFDRPEHKYIILSEEGCRYFVSPPVKTSVNFKAHQKLMELFDNVERN